MKKILSICTLFFLLSACGNDDEEETYPEIENLNIIKKYETAYPADFYKKVERGM